MLRTFANYEDPGEVLHNTCTAFDLGLQYMLVASPYIQWIIRGVLCRARGKNLELKKLHLELRAECIFSYAKRLHIHL